MRALVGSIAIHAACGLVLIAVRASTPPPVEPAAQLEWVTPPVEVAFIDVTRVRDRSGGGGAQGRAATRPAPERVARLDRTPHRQIVRSAPTESSQSDAPTTKTTTAASLAALASASIVDGNAGDGDGGGRGGGHGRGIGRGVGAGLGDRASVGEALPTVPAAPKASKARPAKLIYPTRERTASEGELYSARVIIDSEGYVVGAKLLHSAGPKDADAANMIFRFRYAPALDDDGHPIKSTVEQPFLVQ
jgi:hypothetical protein